MARPADHPGGGHLFFGAGSPARVDTRFSEWGPFNRKPWWSTRPSGRDFVVVIGNGVGGRRANKKKIRFNLRAIKIVKNFQYKVAEYPRIW